MLGTIFAKHLSLRNAVFPVKMPPVNKVQSWSLEGQGSSWPPVNPTCPLTLPHTHYNHSSCLVWYADAKAQKGNIVDGSGAVWPTTQTNGKQRFPPWPITSLAWWWAPKNLHFVHSGQSYGGFKSKVSKNATKVENFKADLRVGLCVWPLCVQKRSKSKFPLPPRTKTLLAW